MLQINRLNQIFTRYFSVRKRIPKTTTTLRDPSIPRIAASSVAALIGRHTYTKREEALCDLAKKYSPETLSIVRTWETRLQRRSRHFLRAQLSRSLPRLNEITDDLTLAYRHPEARSSSNSELAERASNEIHALIQKQAPHLPFRTGREISRAVTQTAAQRHGIYQETVSMERFVQDSGVFVTQRNAQRLLQNFFQLDGTVAYTLSGRIDGYDEKDNCIVEVKSRSSERDPFENGGNSEALFHDVVQLRCYMEMKAGAIRACLVEQFPGGVHLDKTQILIQSDRRRRITYIERDKKEWDDIHHQLLKVVDDLKRFIKDPQFAEFIVRGATVPVSKNEYNDDSPVIKNTGSSTSSSVSSSVSSNLVIDEVEFWQSNHEIKTD
jgi:hypothetical protein